MMLKFAGTSIPAAPAYEAGVSVKRKSGLKPRIDEENS